MNNALLAAPLLCLASFGANAAVMTFDNPGGNGALFDQTLGDIAGLDVSNQTRQGFGNTNTVSSSLAHWTTDYSDLEGVAYPTADGTVGELGFNPDIGLAVTISSFLVGSYPNGELRSATFRLYDNLFNVLWETLDYQISGNAATISVGITHAGPVYFQWGTDWDVAIDDFAYSAAPISAIPLPGGLPLLGAGLAAFWALRRRKT